MAQVALTVQSPRGEELLDELERRLDIQPRRIKLVNEGDTRTYPRKPGEGEDEQGDRIKRELADLDPEWKEHLLLNWLAPPGPD